MPNGRRPDLVSLSLADKAARAIHELTQENDWLVFRLEKLERENRELRAANDDHRVRAQRARTDGVFSRVGLVKSRTAKTSTGTNGERR